MTDDKKPKSLAPNAGERFKYNDRSVYRTQSGRACVDIDDSVARDLRGLTIEQVYRYTYRMLHSCGITTVGRGKTREDIQPGVLEKRYGHLNKGLQRMTLGKIIRAAKNSVGQGRG